MVHKFFLILVDVCLDSYLQWRLDVLRPRAEGGRFPRALCKEGRSIEIPLVLPHPDVTLKLAAPNDLGGSEWLQRRRPR